MFKAIIEISVIISLVIQKMIYFYLFIWIRTIILYISQVISLSIEICLRRLFHINRLEVQVDSKAVLQCVSSSENGSIRGRRLIRKIREIMEQDNIEVHFQHVYREANKVADWLANLGCTLANGTTLFEYPPREVQSLVDDDVLEVSTSRIIRV
jgi:hypothetical protein